MVKVVGVFCDLAAGFRPELIRNLRVIFPVALCGFYEFLKLGRSPTDALSHFTDLLKSLLVTLFVLFRTSLEVEIIFFNRCIP